MLDLYTANNKDIACLEDKLSELQANGLKKEIDFAKEIQEKEQEVKKAKRDLLLARENCRRTKESEIEELSNELNSLKGRRLTVISV